MDMTQWTFGLGMAIKARVDCTTIALDVQEDVVKRDPMWHRIAEWLGSVPFVHAD